MKKTLTHITLLFLALSTTVFAKQLKSFDAVKQAINSGQQLEFVTELNHCSPALKKKITGSFKPNSVIIIGDNRIIASHKHFTLSHNEPKGMPIFEFIKYTLTPDNTLTLAKTVLDAKTLAPTGKTTKLTCKLQEGARIYGLS